MTVYRRTIPLPMGQVFRRTLPLPMGQNFRRTLAWRDASLYRRTIPLPFPGVVYHRTIPLPVGVPATYRRTIPLPMVAFDAMTFRRTIPLPMGQVFRRTMPVPMATAVTYRRTIPLPLSTASVYRRTIPLPLHGRSISTYRRTIPLRIQSRAGQSVTGALRLLLRGRPVEILSGEIWADEGSPYWQSTATLARVEDYALFGRGVAYDLEIYGTLYRQIVDTRSLSRGFSGDQPGDNAQISGLSPVALQGAGWAQGITRAWDAPVLASAVAAEMLGAVSWDAVDWLIPAYRLAVQGQTPLEVVSTLAAAVGATLQSAPDGSLSVRALYPVRAPDLPRANPAATLTDDDIYSVTETPEATHVVNRVRVTDGTSEASGYQDRLEFEADADDPQAGVIRAYPLPWRPGITVRSTRSRVRLYPQGEATREIEEVLEVRDGVAGTQYPPLTLLVAEYLDTDLGAVVVAGSEVRTGEQGWTLLRVRYTVRAIEYRAVSLDPDMQALVVLEGDG